MLSIYPTLRVFIENKSTTQATMGTAPKQRVTTAFLCCSKLSPNSSYRRSMHLSGKPSPESPPCVPLGSKMLQASSFVTMVCMALCSSAGNCLFCEGSTRTTSMMHNLNEAEKESTMRVGAYGHESSCKDCFFKEHIFQI